MPKWEDRSRVGVYLGHSSQHATSVALILNPQTGYISPQFHCIFDDAFDSAKKDAKFEAIWAAKAGLQEAGEEEHKEDYLQTKIPPSYKAPYPHEELRDDALEIEPTMIEDDFIAQEVQDEEDFGVQDDADDFFADMDNPNFDVEEVQEPEGEDNDHHEEQQDDVKRTRSGQVIRPTQS